MNLAAEMAKLPEPITDKQPPYWQFWRHQLWRLAQVDDPAKFELWPCVYHCMLVNHWPDAVTYERLIIGDFLPFEQNEPTPAQYKNLIHQAYHLWKWQQVTGRRVADLSTIVEFGGGYGAMALLCHRLGFRGRYVIYDLPEFSLLQQWYLEQHGVKAEWNPKRKPKGVDLFMALYSLSEVPFEDRPKFEIEASSYLFLYSGLWEGWNNVDYYQRQWPLMRPGYSWWSEELRHLPDAGNHYTIGWK